MYTCIWFQNSLLTNCTRTIYQKEAFTTLLKDCVVYESILHSWWVIYIHQFTNVNTRYPMNALFCTDVFNMRTRNRHDKSHGYQWTGHFVRTVHIIHNIPHIYLIIEIATVLSFVWITFDHAHNCTQHSLYPFYDYYIIAAVVLLQKQSLYYWYRWCLKSLMDVAWLPIKSTIDFSYDFVSY